MADEKDDDALARMQALMPRRCRVAPIFPNAHVTGEQLEHWHKALAKRGVRPDQYRLEGVVVFDSAVEREVCEASYDLPGGED